MKNKYLYHGSIRPIIGDKLIPKKAKDLGKRKENMHKAVYATNVRGIAIAMAVISCEGVHGASLQFKQKPYGIIYEGWPKQENIYLYFLPVFSFVGMGGKGKQFASFKSVRPIKIQKLEVNKYLRFVRKATKKEREEWFEKNKIKINKN